MECSRRSLLLAAAAGMAAKPLPQVQFGSHRISRLAAGGNPVSGNSHISAEADKEMADYFTAANVKKLLRECEAAGINVWQSRADRHVMRTLREYRNEGGKIHWIAQTASELADIARNIRDISTAGAIGAYHHGTMTDRFWAAGKIEAAREYVKVMRDCGLQAGVGTHIPEVIDYIESKGWDLDFYMTCLYNLSRPREGKGEHFLEDDRERMLERVKQSTKQCLIFKVYGAGRRCKSERDMRAAMEQVFAFAKPNDPVIIGMFPKHSEQVRQNCRLVAECARTVS